MNDQQNPPGPEQLRLVQPGSDSSTIQLGPDQPLPALRYRLLTGRDDREFCERISAALDEGYQLYGSPTLAYNGEFMVAAQAVVKDPPPGSGVAGLRPQENP